jgi:hypothetical protein
MSWQGNECFVGGIDWVSDDCNGQMLEALSEMLWMYEDKGPGWYLLGYHDGGSDEDTCGPFETLFYDPTVKCGWLPNPFMNGDVMAKKVVNSHDLFGLAFECWDCGFDAFAYAGDGDEPLEHMVIYGEEYDMRAA